MKDPIHFSIKFQFQVEQHGITIERSDTAYRYSDIGYELMECLKACESTLPPRSQLLDILAGAISAYAYHHPDDIYNSHCAALVDSAKRYLSRKAEGEREDGK